MKILAKFLLFSVFVFLPAVVCAQDFKFFRDCGFAPALEIYTTDGHGLVSPQIVRYLEDGQNCLNIDVMELKDKVKWLDTAVGWNTASSKTCWTNLSKPKTISIPPKQRLKPWKTVLRQWKMKSKS